MKLKTFLLVVIVALCGLIVAGQSTAPAPIKLNLDASKSYVRFIDAERELNRQLDEVRTAAAYLRQGAGVPADFVCEPSADGVVCSKPKPTASPSPGR